ncbi:DHS-like NAD/FAD-binding domain-containing protein [Basidiobolus meristosporus CBS 931.73]|uniref:DHS-like NAD/FAD-binding domain-containing protein n=1 Tax=Basidiobolus meristosporus CBS 931.73 TaxID=1314790 RepID=A0A1Y1Y9J5_9FUNG|nr:DHS-like NAD/FAD-binding domain-containing protein [Basidiobolus meristosporus CBS 931.73]|eukprot:ORX94565.1 DHS-like NAD/FAD-binding domain-containing protein [Basidiobolus meristosporus CBS 931.73]
MFSKVDLRDIFTQTSGDLNDIAQSIYSCKKCVILTGAGISCSAGIPDFRSADGLYNLVKAKFPQSVLKGKDIFDATLFKDEVSTKIFYSFMAELSELTSKAQVTKTHEFIRHLHDDGKLLRCYTQNIDCLEEKLELNTDLLDDSKNVKVVQLHGSLGRVSCTACSEKSDLTKAILDQFHTGAAPPCSACSVRCREREQKGKRSIAVGTLRPDIILYNEHHPLGDTIGKIQQVDLRRKPDLLIIMGTTLKVCGFKNLVKEMARTVHLSKKGKVIFVNKTELPTKEWEGVIDYFVIGETDKWVEQVERLVDELKAKKASRKKKAPVQDNTLDNYISEMTSDDEPLPCTIMAVHKTPENKIRRKVLGRKSVPKLNIRAEPVTSMLPTPPASPVKSRSQSLDVPSDKPIKKTGAKKLCEVVLSTSRVTRQSTRQQTVDSMLKATKNTIGSKKAKQPSPSGLAAARGRLIATGDN